MIIRTGITGTGIDCFQITTASVSGCVDGLRRLGFRVCSFENLTEDDKGPISLCGQNLGEILDAIVAANPGYRWDEPKTGLINIFPTVSILNSRVPDVSVRTKGIWRVLMEDLRINSLGISPFEELGDLEGPSVDLETKHTDLRAALNTIVDRLRPMVWHVAGRPGNYYLSFTCVTEAPFPRDGK